MGVFWIPVDVKFEQSGARKRSFDQKTRRSVPYLLFDFSSYSSARVVYKVDHVTVLLGRGSNSEMTSATRLNEFTDVEKFIIIFKRIITPNSNPKERAWHIIRYMDGNAFDYYYDASALDGELIADRNDYFFGHKLSHDNILLSITTKTHYPCSCVCKVRCSRSGEIFLEKQQNVKTRWIQQQQ